jgi:hypothetical protein
MTPGFLTYLHPNGQAVQVRSELRKVRDRFHFSLRLDPEECSLEVSIKRYIHTETHPDLGFRINRVVRDWMSEVLEMHA